MVDNLDIGMDMYTHTTGKSNAGDIVDTPVVAADCLLECW